MVAAAPGESNTVVGADGNEKVINKEVGVLSNEVASDFESESVTLDAQRGVQKAEATTSVWSNRDLYLAYVL